MHVFSVLKNPPKWRQCKQPNANNTLQDFKDHCQRLKENEKFIVQILKNKLACRKTQTKTIVLVNLPDVINESILGAWLAKEKIQSQIRAWLIEHEKGLAGQFPKADPDLKLPVNNKKRYPTVIITSIKQTCTVSPMQYSYFMTCAISLNKHNCMRYHHVIFSLYNRDTVHHYISSINLYFNNSN